MKNNLSNTLISCPKCKLNQTKKNGFRRGKQCYLCKNCGRQFVLNPTPQSYDSGVKKLCIKMYLNSMGFLARHCVIARVTEISHPTIITWVKLAGENVSDDLSPHEEIPEIIEIDELQTFVGNKKNKVWIWTVVNHWKEGILLWNIEDRSSKTFEPLWKIMRSWLAFLVCNRWLVGISKLY